MGIIKISIIIPVYNAEKYLKGCLESILSQTIKEIEIICIDDGSTDDSYEVMRRYSKVHTNIILRQQKNQGAGPARNKGLSLAHGKYVCFMDSDDYYADRHVLELLYRKAEENHVHACGGNLITVKENGETEKRRNWFQEEGKTQFEDYGDLYYYQCFIFNLKVIRDNNIVFPSYRRYQDPPFLLNIMGKIKEFFAVEDIVYVYREGHKTVEYDANKVCDLLKGVRDCYAISWKYNFVKTYENHLKTALIDYFTLLYPYTVRDNKEIWKLVNEINEIDKNWQGNSCAPLLDRAHMDNFVQQLNRRWNQIIGKCRRAEEVIIYGAGKAGREFLESLEEERIRIKGFAVSEKPAFDTVEGHRIDLIESYDRETIVLVAVGVKYAGDVLENLRRLHFDNVCYMEYKHFMILKQIRKSEGE